jgi:hypothetical protein
MTKQKPLAKDHSSQIYELHGFVQIREEYVVSWVRIG